MSWIQTLAMEEAQGELRALMEANADPESGRLDEILRVHSLHPAGLAAHVGLYRAAMRGTPGLRKVDRELIALHVSLVNDCHY